MSNADDRCAFFDSDGQCKYLRGNHWYVDGWHAFVEPATQPNPFCGEYDPDWGNEDAIVADTCRQSAQPEPMRLSKPVPLPWDMPKLSREDARTARERVNPTPRMPEDKPQPEPRDACEVCKGARGGTPGNENIINGKIMCDDCHANMSKPEPSARETMAGVCGHADPPCQPCSDRAAAAIVTIAKAAEPSGDEAKVREIANKWWERTAKAQCCEYDLVIVEQDMLSASRQAYAAGKADGARAAWGECEKLVALMVVDAGAAGKVSQTIALGEARLAIARRGSEGT